MRPVAADELYARLTFGALGRELTYLCWGHVGSGRNTWLARTDVLSRLGQTAEAVAPEAVPSAVVLRFRDQIEDALRKGRDAPDADRTSCRRVTGDR